MIALGDCSTCKQNGSLCSEGCPVCGSKGILVPATTVQSMLKEGKINLGDTFKLCTTPSCNVSYFSCNELFFDLDEIKVPIWFKKEKQKYVVCYCRNIELQHIIKAVSDLNGEKDLEVLLKHLNKADHIAHNCLYNNPTGVSCEKLMKNAIEYAHKLFIEQTSPKA